MTLTKESSFISYSFSYDGRDYVSRISVDSQLMEQIVMLPSGVFEQINIECLEEYIGKGKSLEEIEEKLVEINENGSFAFIELA